MNIQDCFSSFLKHFPFLKTMISNRMWISYEIVRDKKYQQNLNNFYQAILKKFVKVTMNKKKIYSNFQTQRGDFKTKNKDKKYSIIALFLRADVEKNGYHGECRFERAIQLSFFYSWLLLFIKQLIERNINYTNYTDISHIKKAQLNLPKHRKNLRVDIVLC